MDDYQRGQADVLAMLARRFKPSGDEPSVDPSNHGDTADLAAWQSENYHFKTISGMLDDLPSMETPGLSYALGVTHGFDEAIYEVKRGEIDPQTYQRKT